MFKSHLTGIAYSILIVHVVLCNSNNLLIPILIPIPGYFHNCYSDSINFPGPTLCAFPLSNPIFDSNSVAYMCDSKSQLKKADSDFDSAPERIIIDSIPILESGMCTTEL